MKIINSKNKIDPLKARFYPQNHFYQLADGNKADKYSKVSIRLLIRETSQFLVN